MGTTYNFLKNALPVKRENLQSPKGLVFLMSAVLLTIPLPNIVNSITTILFVVFAIVVSKKEFLRISIALLLPILLYLIMLASLLWSIDSPETIKALSKEIPLLVLPLVFYFLKPGPSIVNAVIRNYSYGMVSLGIFYIAGALIRYADNGSTDAFFYHELVTKDVNAIYMSAMFSIAFFYFLAKSAKRLKHYILMIFLFAIIILLSSKNIIIIDVLIIATYYVFFAPFKRKAKIIAVFFIVAAIIGIGNFSKIKERITAEFIPAEKSDSVRSTTGINNISIYEAYTLPEFQPNDYFNGTAFRVYQLRIFKEMLQQDNILLTGYGLNASLVKIKAKGTAYNVYRGKPGEEGYHMLNFHNQYIEIFADLGIFGFLIFIFIQIFNLKNAVARKDFIHIAFAILMISLFLTESFLWRQRGVVFFTMLYCLFNTNLSLGYSKRNI